MSRPPSRSAISRRAIRVYLTIAGIVVTGLAAAAVGLWARWNEPLPPPPHDERELGEPPDPADNGMAVIAELPLRTFAAPWPAEDELFGEPEGPPSLAALEAARSEIEAFEMPEGIEAQLDDALSRPRFAFACPLDFTADACPAMVWFRAHQALVVLTVRDAMMGFDDEALARAERMVRADRDVVTSARSLFEAMVAILTATHAIELAARLGAIVGGREADAIGPETSARVDALERALTALDPASWSIERALIGESIRTRRALATVVERRERLGLARGVRALDDYYDAAIAYARDPERAPRPAAPEPEDFSSILEPAAVIAVAATIDFTPQIDRFRDTAARSVERVEVARVALAAARARAASSASSE